jgi:hypothetical protein
MAALRRGTVLCLTLVVAASMVQAQTASNPNYGKSQVVQSGAGQLFALANQTRSQYGLGTLKWDPALAAAAQQHCLRMAREGQIAHRYSGEPELTERAGNAGAHFSLIEENVAVSASAARIHQAWMNSPHHRDNLLNPGIDRVGIAVVTRGAAVYAVADYERVVQVLTPAQVEASLAATLRARGLSISRDAGEARAYCAASGRFTGADGASFLMRWQGPDVTQLPQELAKRVASGSFREAAVGWCPAQHVEGPFTVYRVAVLLYTQDSAALQKPSY